MGLNFESGVILEDNTYKIIRNTRNDYEFLLKKYSYYSKKSIWANDFVYHTRHDDENLRKLFVKFRLERFLKIDDEFERIKKVMRWSHEVLLYNQKKKYEGLENATDIIEFCKKNKTTVNCRLHAVVLTEALLALGFYARIVCCMPIDVLPSDSHAMTVVYLKETKKWVLLDSARNCYFTDINDVPLSLSEVRKCLIENLHINIVYMHRFSELQMGNKLQQFDDGWYMDYLYKNLFRFYCSVENGTTASNRQVYYHLVPTGYALVNSTKIIVDDDLQEKIIRITDNEQFFWSIPGIM